MLLVFLNFVTLFLLYRLFESTVSSIVFSLLAILCLYYIKNRTIFLDLKIMLHTLEAIIFRRGAK